MACHVSWLYYDFSILWKIWKMKCDPNLIQCLNQNQKTWAYFRITGRSNSFHLKDACGAVLYNYFNPFISESWCALLMHWLFQDGGFLRRIQKMHFPPVYGWIEKLMIPSESLLPGGGGGSFAMEDCMLASQFKPPPSLATWYIIRSDGHVKRFANPWSFFTFDHFPCNLKCSILNQENCNLR
jgi:hypothetical protein